MPSSLGKAAYSIWIPKKLELFNNNIPRVDFGNQVSPEFINYWFCSASGRAMLDELKSSTTNVAAIYHKDFFTCVVPLPPLAEQKRIVNVIHRLLPLRDNLDEHLADLSERGKQLLKAALRNASVDRQDAVPTGATA